LGLTHLYFAANLIVQADSQVPSITTKVLASFAAATAATYLSTSPPRSSGEGPKNFDQTVTSLCDDANDDVAKTQRGATAKKHSVNFGFKVRCSLILKNDRMASNISAASVLTSRMTLTPGTGQWHGHY
jgi:hypothetical protein